MPIFILLILSLPSDGSDCSQSGAKQKQRCGFRDLVYNGGISESEVVEDEARLALNCPEYHRRARDGPVAALS